MDSIGWLMARLGVAGALASVPLAVLGQLAQGLTSPADVVVRFIGAVAIFKAAIAITDRLGPFRREQ